MHRFAKHVGENLAPTMLRSDPRQTEFVDLLSPFGNKLRADNRWVKLASLMPWAVVEERYAESLAGTGMGRSALPGRVAFGSLIGLGGKGSVHAPEHVICSLNDFSDALFHGSSSQNRIFRCGLSRDGSGRWR